MKRFLGVTAMLFLTVTVGLSQVQIVSPTAAPLFYDMSQEITLTGTVSSLFTKALPGTLPGTHFALTTPNDTLDVSLGAFSFSGKGALSLTEGQQVEVVGVFKKLRERQVLLARTVKVGDKVYAIRNIYGLPVTPKSHERANQEAQNGETR